MDSLLIKVLFTSIIIFRKKNPIYILELKEYSVVTSTTIARLLLSITPYCCFE